jgi:hypothetical protein
MIKNLYPPVYLLSGTGIGTFSILEGCQRVFEPDLSPLLYKSKPVEGYLIMVFKPFAQR